MMENGGNEVNSRFLTFKMCSERDIMLTYAVISAMPRIPCQAVEPGLSVAMASNTMLVPSRLAFLAALGIGHGLPAA